MSVYRTRHWNKDVPGKQPKGSGKVRRYKGKMVLPSGSPRAHTHGGKSQADAGFSTHDCPAGKGRPPGKYRVPPPDKRWQSRGIVRNATTGERLS